MLEPIPELIFYPKPHRYRYKDKWLLHSVTGIIGHDMSQAKKAAINHYKDGPKGWAARGAALHSVLETKLKGENVKEDELWQKWIDPLLDCELFEDATTLATEYSLCDKKKSIGGSFDFLIQRSTGEIVLGDLKTSSSKRAAQQRDSASEQLGAYELMLEQHHPGLLIDTCCTVILGPGICRVEREKPDKCVEQWREKWSKFEITQEDW